MTLIKKCFYFLTAMLAALFLVAPVTAHAAVVETQPVVATDSYDDDVEELLNYAILNENGDIVKFDIESARSNNASSLVLASIEEFNSMVSGDNLALESKTSRGVSIPVYGNWCGPGHSGPGAPIDLLDSRCKTHDLCYARNGYHNKNCDRVLVAQITVDMNAGRYSGWTWVVANAIRSFFLPNTI